MSKANATVSDRISTVRAPRRDGISRLSNELLIAAGIIVLAGVFALTLGEKFFSVGTLSLLGQQLGILVIVAAAQTFPILVGGFDLSVAANMGFASTIAALAMVNNYTVESSIAFALMAGALVGVVNGVCIAVLKISPFVVTLGTLTFLGGFGNTLAGGSSIAGLPDRFTENWGGGTWMLGIPSAAGIGAIVIALVWLLLSYTRVGLQVYAVGGSSEASSLAGTRVWAVQVFAYLMSGLLSALGGVVLAARVGIGQPSLGGQYDLLSIAAVVIGGVAIGGGVGRIGGVVLGALLLTLVTIGLDIGAVSQFTQQMVTGVVLIGAVWLSQLKGQLRFRRSWGTLRTARTETSPSS
ncbi:ABC transporter permease [Microbacterium sp. ZW CA_36]|uniref:ABC transporter permease n=1 Tax=Microbacterium sp. ZW CA_36 TaxID=3378078 RepID=UPI0038538A41